MNDYKELIANLREEADAVQAIEWDIPICTDNHIREAADVIEQQRAEIVRLTAENRAKEQYIAEHMGGTAERNARMKRDAERLRGTGKNK